MIKKTNNWNKITVALVNYNNKDVINECIDSIYQNTKVDIEILVVDNGSSDESMSIIEAKYPLIHTIYLEQNEGWGAGCNVCFKNAFENGSEYVLLLNTDTEIEPGLIDKLLEYADPNTITIPRMYFDKENPGESLWYSGGRVDFETAQTEQTIFDASHTENEEVNFITGCCALIHRDIYNKIGGFDEAYFLYYEDVDYSVKALEAGIRMLYVPEVGLWHKIGGSSGGGLGAVSQYYTVRNRLFFANRFAHLMKSSVMDILNQIYKEREYCKISVFYDSKDIVEAGIRDFLNGVRGKEGNFIHDCYTMLHGFDVKEVTPGGVMQRALSKESEMLITNKEKTGRMMTFSASYIDTSLSGHKQIRVYWDDAYKCTINTPAPNFQIRGKMGSFMQSRIRFEVDCLDSPELYDKRTAFILINPVLHGEGGVVLTSGVYSTENSQAGVFHWVLSPELGMTVQNERCDAQKYILKFLLHEAPGRNFVNARIVGKDIDRELHIGANEIQLSMDALEERELYIRCEDEPVKDFCGDPRTFYFRIFDFSLTAI